MHGSNLQQLVPALIFMVLMLAMFYWVVIRPTQIRQKRHQEMVARLKVGDRVITVGGIYGKIVNVGEKSLGIEIAKGITVTFDRRAIRRLQEEEDF
jgi:preprotein translocase subunit YajC